MRHYKMGYSSNKYRNRKFTTERYGKFDSKHEYETFLYLLALQQKGYIYGLIRQVTIDLTPNKPKNKVKYIADFAYRFSENGELVIADAKGMPTPEYRVKREWLLHDFNGFTFVELFKGFAKNYIPIGNQTLNL